MTIRHHPAEALLTAFAAGTLDRGRHAAVATHLAACVECRAWTRSVEHVAGAVLEHLPPAALSTDALHSVEAKLRLPAEPLPSAPASTALNDVPGLPQYLRRLPVEPWRWVAPGLQSRAIVLPDDEPTRVFLLKSAPGAQLLEHTHTDFEMTCVLSGGFTHAGGHFGPGDFDLGEAGVDHRITIDREMECVCLVAMQGQLRLNGILGRVLQPFVRV